MSIVNVEGVLSSFATKSRNILYYFLFRKYCKKCRYKKCIDSGMKPELVDASRRNKEADMKAMAGRTIQSLYGSY